MVGARQVIAVCALLLGGCALHTEVVTTRVQEFASWDDAAPLHRLGAGDEVELRFLLNTDLNDRLLVGPDGRVTAPLIGPVMAEGQTIGDFQSSLSRAYAHTLRNPALTVAVRTYGSSRIFVGGEVKTPGVLALPGPVDVLQGVTMAGGLLPTARTDEVVIIRRRADQVPMLRTVNLKRFSGQVTAADDFPLRSGDVVFVPKSGVAEFNQFVDQYLNQALPFQKALSLNVGSGKVF